MADWRQIQARIRKAKNASDAHAKLTELYQRTRDAMVAWELGVIEEKAGQNEEAVKWYKTAVERFRRKDWKNKAEEALTRLGAEIPATSQESGAEPSAAERAESLEVRATPGREEEELILPLALGEIPANESEEAPGESPSTTGTPPADGAHKKRRRGRRGGRGRRRKGGAETSRLPSQAFAESSDAASAHHTAAAPPVPFQRTVVPERSRPLPFERPAA
ncbi:MAG: tetratricopeptide repeat protein, partial [Candidatus Acidiferrales bacterium]